MLTALSRTRRFLKPNLPPWAHEALRVAFYRLALPPARLFVRIRELMGVDYSAAPPGYILAQYGLPDSASYTRTGQKKLKMIKEHLARTGFEISPHSRILDFGVGSARALCAFHDEYPQASCYGCDLKADVVEWANKYRPELTVVKNELLPPLRDDLKDFHLVYALSVWTHMPEPACSAWLRHMHERIKPGGVLFLTIAEPSTEVARNHGFDPDALAARVRANGGCLYDPGTDMTYIQKEWLESQIKGRFTLRYFGEAQGHTQYAVVLQRSAAKRSRSGINRHS